MENRKITIDFVSRSMKKISIILIFLLSMNLYSRKEVNIWYFGKNAGLDFNSGSPVTLLDGKINSNEGCATLSDRYGNLLFYTDGSTVWDREHSVMPNGTGLLGHTSSTQSSVIVPAPNNPNLYYIFTVDDKERNNGFRFTVVNMKLNKGLGDVDTSQKNVLLFAPSTEKICVINNYDCSAVWVISHEWNSNAFRAYLLNDKGIDTTNYIVSKVGIKYEGSVHNKKGYLKAYIDGSKIAAASGHTSTFELFDFNDTTGVLSNPIRLAYSDYEAYGVEFSPDGTKLYASVNYVSDWWLDINDNVLWQFDISSGEQNTIRNSRRTIATQYMDEKYGALQLGPDGKIYVAREGKSYLGVINSPNEYGSACSYNASGVNLQGRNCLWGLPYFIQDYFYQKTFTHIPYLSSKVGTNKQKVPIYASLNCGNTDTLTLSLDMSVSFDVSIFYFLKANGCSFKKSEVSNKKYMTVNIRKDSIKLTSEPQMIAELIGDVLHGWDSDTTLFKIESFNWLNSSVEFDTSSGLLSTYGICLSDLKRIIFIEKEMLKVQPNPVSDILNITVRTGGEGKSQVTIYDLNGDIVLSRTWLSHINGGETKVFDIDFSDKQSGVYFVELKTPYNIFVEKIMIVR